MHCIAAKMIHNRELFGSLDQPTQTIFMRKEEPSSLQLMALNFAEKISQLVDNSEKLLDMRQQTQQGGSQGGGGRGRPRQ